MAKLFHIRENTTPVYTAVIRDENGNVLPDTALDSLLMTYYDVDSGEIINNRNAQNILNANDVTVDNVGQLTWDMRPADTAIIDGSSVFEEKVAVISWSWTVSLITRQSNQEVRFHIQNLAKVP